MSTYQRPLRSDELMHWGRKGFHKYIAKIGNRYFYTQDEINAYKLAQVEGHTKAANFQKYADTNRKRAEGYRQAAQNNANNRNQARHDDPKNRVKALFSGSDAKAKTYRDKAANARNIEALSVIEEARNRKRASDMENSARLNEQKAKQALIDEERKKQNIVKDKSLLTQMAFKRAVEKDDRKKAKAAKRKSQREAGRKKVMDYFRKKGWIY